MGVSIDAQVLKDGLVKYFVDDDMSQAYRDLQENGKSIKRIFALIWEGVEAIEILAKDLGMVTAGHHKKEALVSWLDESVKFSGLMKIFEAIDGKLIGAAIDGIILFLNGRFGNDWLGRWSKFI